MGEDPSRGDVCAVDACQPNATLARYVLSHAMLMINNKAARGASLTSLAGKSYTYITEGRRNWEDSNGDEHKYGWCGDLVTKGLYDGGVRSPLINRVEMNGSWKIGRNISDLQEFYSAAGALLTGSNIMELRPGDAFCVGPSPSDPSNDIHIGWIASSTGGQACTFNGNGIGSVATSAVRSLGKTGDRIVSIAGRVLWWVGRTDLITASAPSLFLVSDAINKYSPPMAKTSAAAGGGDGDEDGK